jgi:hypothetical protein
MAERWSGSEASWLRSVGVARLFETLVMMVVAGLLCAAALRGLDELVGQPMASVGRVIVGGAQHAHGN